MPLTLLDFVEQVPNVTVEDIPDDVQESVNEELQQQTSAAAGGGGGLSSPGDSRIVAETSSDLGSRPGYTSIQDAIDGTNPVNGAPSSAVPTDGTVFVEPGTYNESVSITTSGVTLQSTQGAGQTTVVGDGESVGSKPHAAIHVDDGSGPVRNVTVDGFTVRNPNGKFGIFAGTGTTSATNDGIGGLVVKNNVVSDISTTSTGGALTGGPSGIGIRGDYGTGGNPGIKIDSNIVRNVKTSSSVNAVGITLKSFTGNAGFGKDSSGASVSDSASPPATNTKILNNSISKIFGGGGSRTKGISVSGEFEGVEVINNSITDISAETGTGSNGLAITFTENGGSYSGNQYDIDNDGSGERIGPRNFTIDRNEISDVSADDQVSLFIGGYEDLGNHIVKRNNFLDTGAGVARYAGDQSGYQIGDGDTLLVQNNYWGASSGPSGEDGVGGGSGAPAVTLGTDSGGSGRSGKVAASESASNSSGYSSSKNPNAGSTL